MQIEDTGVGIPEGSKDRIFEPFQQLHSSMERRYWGTGEQALPGGGVEVAHTSPCVGLMGCRHWVGLVAEVSPPNVEAEVGVFLARWRSPD